jgi:ferrous iron transport protein A
MYRFGRRFGHRFGGDKKQLTLAQMQTGQSGKVVQITGGSGLINRLNALGIRLGQRVTKVGSMYMRGPVMVQLGNTRVAIGFGMAKKIIMEAESSRNEET